MRQGRFPWGSPQPGADTVRPVSDVAASRTVRYQCSCAFAWPVRLSHEAAVPSTWVCPKCSGAAPVADAAGGDVQDEARGSARDSAGRKTHWETVLQRRTIEELEVLLEQRLEVLYQRRGQKAS